MVVRTIHDELRLRVGFRPGSAANCDTARITM